jgi:hypothetical protein
MSESINISTFNRIVRLVIGLGLALVGWQLGPVGMVLWVNGYLIALTGLLGFCPVCDCCRSTTEPRVQ